MGAMSTATTTLATPASNKWWGVMRTLEKVIHHLCIYNCIYNQSLWFLTNSGQEISPSAR
jgi:hypothetical protein